MSSMFVILAALGLIVLLALGLIASGLVRTLGGGDGTYERLQTYGTIPEVAQPRELGRGRLGLVRLRVRLNAMLSALGSEELNLQLLSANWLITVTEFILLRLAITITILLLGWLLFHSLVSGAALAIITYMVPGILLNRSIHRRRLAFERQLVDVLVLINGAVRAGFSLLQAVEVVEKELKAPASEEFHRVLREVGLGLPLSEALTNLSARMHNADLDLMVTAINIQFKVGGNLATMLAAVTDTLRDRIRLFSEVRVITTQQRYTSYLISLLPFFVGAILFLMNPDYMMRLFEPTMLCFPAGALIGIILGNIVIRRLAKIEV
jgi:tight adherence protein B